MTATTIAGVEQACDACHAIVTIPHALDRLVCNGCAGNYGPELVIPLPSGFALRCDATDPDGIDYVRITTREGHEHVFWQVDEIAEAPGEVIGALFGALATVTPVSWEGTE